MHLENQTCMVDLVKSISRVYQWLGDCISRKTVSDSLWLVSWYHYLNIGYYRRTVSSKTKMAPFIPQRFYKQKK